MSVASPPSRAPAPVEAPAPAPSRTHDLRFLVGWLALALAIAELPLLLSTCCAPAGHTGLGTVWFVNDFAQYESAMRQGAERSDWLIQDMFTVEPHAAAFMFPLYVAIGKLAALTGIPALWLERVLEVVARAALVVALWRFVRTFAKDRRSAKVAFLLALFGGDVGLLIQGAAALAGLGTVYTGNHSYEVSTFGTLFAAPHVPLALAATLELAREFRPDRPPTAVRTLWAILLGAVIALLHPFHEPVVLGCGLIAGIVWWRAGRGPAVLITTLAALLGALPVLAPTVATFTTDPFWSATYTVQNILPSPLPHQLFVDLGITLCLALAGAWMTRGHIGPFVLVLWLLLALIAMYIPVPYQRRLAFGAQPALAVLAGNAVIVIGASLPHRVAYGFRLATVFLAGQAAILVVIAVIASALTNEPVAVYRSTPDLDAAAAWLDGRARPGQVILTDWDTGNYLAARTDARVVGGHPVATLHVQDKQLLIAAFFAHGGSLAFARAAGADWVVIRPGGENAVSPLPAPTFQAGAVAVYALGPST